MNLKINNLTKKFGNKTVLNNINIEFNNGIYAILGPNGAGKSTLINIIMGLVPCSNGTIELNGKNINKQTTDFLKYIGYMPQSLDFYKNFSGEDMLVYIGIIKGLSKKESQSRAIELLKSVNLYNDKDKKVGAYSGGMKQRLGIAQTLISNPPILIFDEPTAGLDPLERIRFRNIITNLSNDKIVIICTHIVSDVDTISDKIIMLKNGNVTVIDSPSNICKSLDGCIWKIETDFNNLETLTKELNIHSVSRENDKYILKAFSKNKPTESAQVTAATLEDAYLRCFDEEDSNAFSL